MAAAEYADGKGSPPEELRLAFRCQQWGTLPHSGGLLDQPAGLVERMTIAVNVYNAWKAYIGRDVKNDAQFFKTELWEVAKKVLELRKHG